MPNFVEMLPKIFGYQCVGKPGAVNRKKKLINIYV